MYRLIIKPSAEMDALDAANWYNLRLDGLGNEFRSKDQCDWAKSSAIYRDLQKYKKGFN
jgi:hypothetical protein